MYQEYHNSKFNNIYLYCYFLNKIKIIIIRSLKLLDFF